MGVAPLSSADLSQFTPAEALWPLKLLSSYIPLPFIFYLNHEQYHAMKGWTDDRAGCLWLMTSTIFTTWLGFVLIHFFNAADEKELILLRTTQWIKWKTAHLAGESLTDGIAAGQIGCTYISWIWGKVVRGRRGGKVIGDKLQSDYFKASEKPQRQAAVSYFDSWIFAPFCSLMH